MANKVTDFFGGLGGSLVGENGIVTNFFKWIGKASDDLWEWIKGLFSGAATQESKNLINDALNGGDAKSPEVAANSPAVAAAPTKAPEQAPEKPMVDDRTRAEIALMVSGADSRGSGLAFIPETYKGYAQDSKNAVDPTYGTSANPAIEQAKDGRLIVNVPTGANVGFRALEGQETMAVLTIMPPIDEFADKEKPKSFQIRAYPISKHLLENKQVVFKEVTLKGTPADADGIRVSSAYGVLPQDTTLVMQGVNSDVNLTNVDAVINGNVQKGFKTSRPLSWEEQKIAGLNKGHAADKQYLAEWTEARKNNGPVFKNGPLAQARREQGVAYSHGEAATHHPAQVTGDLPLGGLQALGPYGTTRSIGTSFKN